MAKKRGSTKGRRKIEIKKIESEDIRHVCFSKRRSGLFTKASDLATLCGAQLAIVVDSPAGNPYAFGNPGVSQVASRFFGGGDGDRIASLSALQDGYKRGTVRQLSEQCRELSYQLGLVDAKKAMFEGQIAELVRENQICRHAEDMEDLGLAELMQLKESLTGVRERAKERVHEILMSQGASSSSNVARFANPMGPTSLW